MGLPHRVFFLSGLAFICGLVVAGTAAAQRVDQIAPSVDNLRVVLREWQGANRQEETLKPVGKVWAEFDGKTITLELAWYQFIGDMQVRFVFEGAQSFKNATAEEFARLHLTPEEAVERALANIKRVHGAPQLAPWDGGLTLIQAGSPDLDSSFFLDRPLWRGLLTQHPEGLIVAVPNRGGLAFVPVADNAAVALLGRDIARLYRSSEGLRISSALYLFKDDRWTVFKPPVGAR